jgi:hypothetical protein
MKMLIDALRFVFLVLQARCDPPQDVNLEHASHDLSVALQNTACRTHRCASDPTNPRSRRWHFIAQDSALRGSLTSSCHIRRTFLRALSVSFHCSALSHPIRDDTQFFFAFLFFLPTSVTVRAVQSVSFAFPFGSPSAHLFILLLRARNGHTRR